MWKVAWRWKEIERDGSRVVKRRSKIKERGRKMVVGWKISEIESGKKIKRGVY